MTSALRGYLLSIVSASLLLTVTLSVIPKGAIHKMTGIVGGLLVVLAVMSPLTKMDGTSVAAAISEYSMKSDYVQRGIEIENRQLLCEVITEKCETYILDKAERMGMTIEADIVLQEDAEYPFPISVVLKGTWSAQEQKILSSYISEELGIPAQRQEWLLM